MHPLTPITEIGETLIKAVQTIGISNTITLLLLFYILFYRRDLLHIDFSKKREMKEEDVESVLKVDNEIMEVLKEMRRSLNAGWVTLWQFHNGTFSLAGVPFLKVSATHEAGAPNLYLYAKDFRDLPISLFTGSATFNTVFDYSYFGDEDSSRGGVISSLMQTYGVKSLYAFPIRTVSNSLVGFVTVAFYNVRALNEDEIEIAQARAERVSGVLEVLSKK